MIYWHVPQCCAIVTTHLKKCISIYWRQCVPKVCHKDPLRLLCKWPPSPCLQHYKCGVYSRGQQEFPQSWAFGSGTAGRGDHKNFCKHYCTAICVDLAYPLGLKADLNCIKAASNGRSLAVLLAIIASAQLLTLYSIKHQIVNMHCVHYI